LEVSKFSPLISPYVLLFFSSHDFEGHFQQYKLLCCCAGPGLDARIVLLLLDGRRHLPFACPCLEDAMLGSP
jgi:hypothetical protein